MVIQNKSKKIKFIASISLLVFMIAAYNVCRIPTATNAESYGTSFSVEDSTYLNVSIPESVILNVTPTAAGQFAKTSMEISVDTNNTTGYTLTMTADTTSLSRTSAVNGIDYSIPTLEQAYTCTDESATTCDNFPVGYWGYKFTNAEATDTNTYNPMTTTASPIRFLKEFKNTTDTTTVTFGTKLSNSIPNGTYDGVNLTFIATTNYVIPETAKYMQDFNAVIADSLTPGITYTTKDSRDNQDYTVAKLADGNVWMTKNLNLAGGTTITPADSNVAENYTLPANSTTTTSGFSEVANFANTDCNGMQPCYSYYNWYVSTANTNPSDGVIKNDICAKGWKIPTAKNWLSVANGGSILSYENSILHITRNSIFSTDGNFYKEDNRSQYWASCDTAYCTTVQGNVTDYYLGLNWSGLNSSSPRAGDTVRCIFDRSMQNFSATDAAAMSEGQTITLVDNRDGKEYEVTKINGRVWMTQNLAFTGTQLTPADSNVSENTTMTWYELAKDSQCFLENGYNNACMKNSENGVWYNYAGASANTIEGASNSATAVNDICPKGWRLFTVAERNALISNIGESPSMFNPTTGGYYRNDQVLESAATDGFWWTSSYINTSGHRAYLNYNKTSDTLQSAGNQYYTTGGFFVRCIFSGE